MIGLPLKRWISRSTCPIEITFTGVGVGRDTRVITSRLLPGEVRSRFQDRYINATAMDSCVICV